MSNFKQNHFLEWQDELNKYCCSCSTWMDFWDSQFHWDLFNIRSSRVNYIYNCIQWLHITAGKEYTNKIPRHKTCKASFYVNTLRLTTSEKELGSMKKKINLRFPCCRNNFNHSCIYPTVSKQRTPLHLQQSS